MGKRTPGLLVMIAIYQKLNGQKPHVPSDYHVNRIEEEMCDVTEEPIPETEENRYRIASLYVLYKESFDRHAEEQVREYREVYG